eukprot:GHVT01070267.1.p1 GENE.GHVT01070267.1~~GHVT01070267.1.p1  ORF type:complete len:435 (-),score=44.64 GHVT01070267.1:1815-3119(-)
MFSHVLLLSTGIESAQEFLVSGSQLRSAHNACLPRSAAALAFPGNEVVENSDGRNTKRRQKQELKQGSPEDVVYLKAKHIVRVFGSCHWIAITSLVGSAALGRVKKAYKIHSQRNLLKDKHATETALNQLEMTIAKRIKGNLHMVGVINNLLNNAKLGSTLSENMLATDTVPLLLSRALRKYVVPRSVSPGYQPVTLDSAIQRLDHAFGHSDIFKAAQHQANGLEASTNADDDAAAQPPFTTSSAAHQASPFQVPEMSSPLTAMLEVSPPNQLPPQRIARPANAIARAIDAWLKDDPSVKEQMRLLARRAFVSASKTVISLTLLGPLHELYHNISEKAQLGDVVVDAVEMSTETALQQLLDGSTPMQNKNEKADINGNPTAFMQQYISPSKQNTQTGQINPVSIAQHSMLEATGKFHVSATKPSKQEFEKIQIV